MSNIIIKNSEVVFCKEDGTSKKIKVDGTKLGIMKAKAKVKSEPIVEEKTFDFGKVDPSVKPMDTARHIPNFQKVEEPDYIEERPVETARYNANVSPDAPDFRPAEEESKNEQNMPGEPMTFDRSENKKLFDEISFAKPNEAVKAEKPGQSNETKKTSVPNQRVGDYVVPTIVSPGNTGDRTEKFKKLLQTTEQGTYVYRVLSNGVDKLNQNKEMIAQIKGIIKELNEEIQQLENRKAIVASGKKNIEELLSATMPISLGEIKAAADTEAFSKANAEIAKIKSSVDNLATIKKETEEDISQIDTNKEGLKQEKVKQEGNLADAEKKGVELCNTLEKDLTTAAQIEKLQNEQKTLEEQLNLLKEEVPKKATGINPFDKLRAMEDEVERTQSR